MPHTNEKAQGVNGSLSFQNHTTNDLNSPTSCADSKAVVVVNEVTLTITATEARIDSRMIAQALGNTHKAVIALIDRYLSAFNNHGQLTFKKEVGTRKHGGGNAERYALLTEDQSYFLLSLSRNSDRVVSLKSTLIKTFGEYRRRTSMRHEEYLPTYHALQDAIHLKAAESPNKKMVHMNVAKAVNATVGIESGERSSVSATKQALLVLTQDVAARAMLRGVDHHDGFQHVKRALKAVKECIALNCLEDQGPVTRKNGREVAHAHAHL
jgi:phage regulator Rha-like protein